MYLHKALHKAQYKALLKLYIRLCLKLTPCYKAAPAAKQPPQHDGGIGFAKQIHKVGDIVSFPDLLAKADLAKPLTAFGKTFVRRSGT